MKRCEVCGEPISICGGCGMKDIFKTAATNEWGRPPSGFSPDCDPYKTLEFKRRYWKEVARGKNN